MHIDISPDQEFLRETTAKFLGAKSPLRHQRETGLAGVGFDIDYWRQGAELGWTSFVVSEDNGGGSVSGNGLADLCIIAHEFGRTAAPGPLVATNLVAAALDAAPGEQHGPILEAILAGTTIAACCIEESSQTPVLEPALRIIKDGGDLILDGIKCPIEAADQADHLLVTGVAELGVTQVLVPRETPGLTIRGMDTVDLTRRFSLVEFDQVRVPDRFAVGEVGQAAESISRLFRIAMVVLSAEMVGAMERGFEMSLEWAFDRHSFGRPLASYQELKHRFADMKCWLEASHAIADAASAAVDPLALDQLGSAAKAYTGHYGAELLQDCMQIHGGIALTFDHDLHILLRRLIVDRMLFGDPAEHRQRLAFLAAQGA
jgi:alkylation response protein AidB-like acyl-CoA dehydrogenase